MNDFTVSQATRADYPAFARLFPQLTVPEGTPSEDRFAESIAPDAFFVRDGNEVVGYAWVRPRGERLHVVHVIVDPAHRRRGVGHALMRAAAERARRIGLSRWMLNVRPENVAARMLYERWGMRASFESVSMRLAWSDVTRLPAAPSVIAGSLAPADDARFEQALAAPAGEIGAFRALGRIAIGAQIDGQPVGFCAFDPPFPGTAPFRVRAPEHARALLEAAREHALPDRDHVFVFAEGDPALADALENAGATPALRVLRMEGDLPQ